MEQLIAQLFKESLFAGFLAVVLWFMFRQQDRRLEQLVEVGLIESLLLTQLQRSFEAHSLTVTGTNPSVDLSAIDDDRVRAVVAKYKSIDARLANIEGQISAALDRLMRGRNER